MINFVRRVFLYKHFYFWSTVLYYFSMPFSALYIDSWVYESRCFSSTGQQVVLSKIKIQASGFSSNMAFSLSVAVTKTKLFSITSKSNIAIFLLPEWEIRQAIENKLVFTIVLTIVSFSNTKVLTRKVNQISGVVAINIWSAYHPFALRVNGD